MILKKYRIHSRDTKFNDIIRRLDKIERAVKGMPEDDRLYAVYDTRGVWQINCTLDEAKKFAELWSWSYKLLDDKIK